MAESIISLSGAVVQFVPQLLPALISGAQDKDDEVRSNSVFGLGVLAEHGGASMHKYPTETVYISYSLLILQYFASLCCDKLVKVTRPIALEAFSIIINFLCDKHNTCLYDICLI